VPGLLILSKELPSVHCACTDVNVSITNLHRNFEQNNLGFQEFGFGLESGDHNLALLRSYQDPKFVTKWDNNTRFFGSPAGTLNKNMSLVFRIYPMS
jgi:hypothetical protein